MLVKATAPRLPYCANAGFQRDYSKYLSGAELHGYYACGRQTCNSASRKNVAASPHYHSRLGLTSENGTFPSSRVWPGWAGYSSVEVATIYIMQSSIYHAEYRSDWWHSFYIPKNWMHDKWITVCTQYVVLQWVSNYAFAGDPNNTHAYLCNNLQTSYQTLY